MSGRTGVLSPRGAGRGGLADLAEPTVAMADQRLNRRRRRRRALRLARRGGAWLCVGLLVVALGGALASGGGWLLTAPRFAVERVEVAGQSQLSVDQVVEASGLVPGQNLFRLDARQAVAGVEALPMVRRAELVRAFPNRVTLLVEERRPFVLVHAGSLPNPAGDVHWPAGGFHWPAGGFHWVDEQGVPLGPETRAVALDAPLVSAAGAGLVRLVTLAPRSTTSTGAVRWRRSVDEDRLGTYSNQWKSAGTLDLRPPPVATRPIIAPVK
jgi:hypothetical protein